MTEVLRFFVGLDLGQRCDHSALVAVELAELILDELDRVTYERRRERRMRVRLVQRIALGTAYPDVVELVRRVVRDKELAGRCTLVVDATGVGAPVMDMLRRAGWGCPIEGVVLTGGEQESRDGGLWRVPKQDLISGLRVMLENRELGISPRVASARALAKELGEMAARGGKVGAWRAGEHDDLVTAAALACWRARLRRPPFWGTRSLGLG